MTSPLTLSVMLGCASAAPASAPSALPSSSVFVVSGIDYQSADALYRTSTTLNGFSDPFTPGYQQHLPDPECTLTDDHGKVTGFVVRLKGLAQLPGQNWYENEVAAQIIGVALPSVARDQTAEYFAQERPCDTRNADMSFAILDWAQDRVNATAACGWPSGGGCCDGARANAKWDPRRRLYIVDSPIDNALLNTVGRVRCDPGCRQLMPSSQAAPTSAQENPVPHGVDVAQVAVGPEIGIAPGAPFTSVSIGDENASAAALLCAMEWLKLEARSIQLGQGVAIVNITTGFHRCDRPDDAKGCADATLYRRLQEEAAELSESALIVAAAGNNLQFGSDPPLCDWTPIAEAQLRVGATKPDDRPAGMSEAGSAKNGFSPCVNVFAPGDAVWVGGTDVKSGTSLAAPIVTAAAMSVSTGEDKPTPENIRDAVLWGGQQLSTLRGLPLVQTP